ncbi:hypothetical protein L596_013691 [Steinernema carpocapsae]|uniref:Uncharacterized protein n=1 Tax=Steinernema carpocapsae TaxID=34508 RepID=A0A4U5P0X4_STECR|nr:hypothetical protein L596_013691 [Steinernema carpocapsae]
MVYWLVAGLQRGRPTRSLNQSIVSSSPQIRKTNDFLTGGFKSAASSDLFRQNSQDTSRIALNSSSSSTSLAQFL